MRIYAIECSIERGAFTNERTFQIPLSDEITTFDGRRQGQLVGTAHKDHLLDENKQPLDEDSPAYGTTMRAMFCVERSVTYLTVRPWWRFRALMLFMYRKIHWTL